MGIPRPTLYRYLREYSIPHLRRAGRISIPEESFEKIRQARDLHKEGLGTESVRRAVREGDASETDDLKRRVDGLHDILEGLRGSMHDNNRPAATEPALPSPALQTILARQSLLMSALFHLTEMVEDLLLASGKRRKPVFPDLEVDLRDEASLTQAPGGPSQDAREALPAPVVSAEARRGSESSHRDVPSGGTISGFAASPGPDRNGGFGSLGRRRRRGGAAILAALLAVVLLAFAVPALVGGGGSDSSSGGGGAQGSGQEARGEGGSGAQQDRASGEGSGGGGQGPAGEGRPAGAVADSGTEVPDVSGSSVEQARGALREAGLTVGATRSVASREMPEGSASGTEPSAGSLVEEETPITLLVSDGPDRPSGTDGSTGASAGSSAPASPASSASPVSSAGASSASSSASAGASARSR